MSVRDEIEAAWVYWMRGDIEGGIANAVMPIVERVVRQTMYAVRREDDNRRAELPAMDDDEIVRRVCGE